MKTAFGYDKDSFDRYGDDLCELILSYLPLREKFGYQCVSQQWARTINLDRINNLVLNKNDSIGKQINIYKSRTFFLPDCMYCIINKNGAEWLDSKKAEIDLKKFEKLLKILTKLKTLFIYKCNINNDIIILIAKYCKNLVRFGVIDCYQVRRLSSLEQIHKLLPNLNYLRIDWFKSK